MAGTGVGLNFSGVMFASTAITRVTSLSFSDGGNIIYFSGDANVYNVVAAQGVSQPTATLTSADNATLFGFAIGQQGTLTGTILDAKAVSGGNVIFTLSNAVCNGPDMSAQHAQFASSTVTFGSISADGTTNPLAISSS